MPLQTQLGILTASTDAGGIALTNTQALTIETVIARGGDVALRTTSGDLTILGHTVRATTGSVRLTAAGSILAGTPGSHVVAASDSVLWAEGGVIGSCLRPLEVQVNGGTLGVWAGGQQDGIAVYINGSVLPTDTLALLSVRNGEIWYPGQVWFAGRLLWPVATTLPFGWGSGLADLWARQAVRPTLLCNSRVQLTCRLLSTGAGQGPEPLLSPTWSTEPTTGFLPAVGIPMSRSYQNSFHAH